MKKIIATILAIGGLALYASAEGYFTIDSTANSGDGATTASTTGGLVFLNGVLDTGTDINLGILWGTSATTCTTPLNMDPLGLNSGAYAGNHNWITSQPTGSGDITLTEDGTLLDPNGLVSPIPGTVAGQTVYIELQGWTGSAPSYLDALFEGNGLTGQTAPFAVTLLRNIDVPQADIHNMPSLDLVPEPSTLALAGLGGLSLLLIRRRKQA